tara:strand:+ start:93 stop:560 length:468 start_codon:yes stop_codon:yes gene_type:complete
MFTITCHYIQNQLGKDDQKLWCFDYEFPNGSCIEDEPLLHSATRLVNALLKQKYGEEKIKEIQDGLIKIEFSIDEYQSDYDIRLKCHLPKDEMGGSIYHCLDYLQLEDFLQPEESFIWLCPVLTDFYPKELPKMMYVTVTKIPIPQGVQPKAEAL